MKHRKEIDGLRAIAVIPVIFWHAGFSFMSGGYAGVDVFFVVSGFLITSILLEDLQEGRYSILNFYERRARRILPAMLIVILTSSIFAWIWLVPDAFLDYCKSVISALFFFSNFYFWISTNYFSPTSEHLPLIHTWSLAVEEQFYVFFPPALFIIFRYAHHYMLWILILLSGASLILAEIFVKTDPDMAFFLAPMRAWELLSGAILALLAFRHPQFFALSRPGRLLSIAGLGMVCLSFILYDEFTPDPSIYTFLPVLGTALILAWGRSGTFVAILLSQRPLRWIGAISYSAYLWHQPIFAFARIRMAETPSNLIMGALIGLSLGLATLSWYFIEQPARRTDPAAPIRTGYFIGLMLGGATLLSAAAILGVALGGAGFRLPADVNLLVSRFADARQEREVVVRVGQCQFNEIKTGVSVGDFLKNWSCRAQNNEGRTAIAVAIIGDSHAADVAGAMRLNGYDILQMGGAGCSVAPMRMTPDCRRLALFVKEEMSRLGLSEIWLVNRFDRSEVTPEAIENAVDFWSAPGIRVTIFSPMPEFPDMQDKMISAKWHGETLNLQRSVTVADTFFASLALLDFDRSSVRVLDSGALFCASAGDGCLPFDGEHLLMMDGQHLTAEGQRRFGQQILKAIGTVPTKPVQTN